MMLTTLAIALSGALFLFLHRYRAILRLLSSSGPDTFLAFPTNHVDICTVTIVIATLIARSVTRTLTSYVLGKPRSSPRSQPISLTMPFRVKDDEIRLYQSAIEVNRTEWDNSAQLALFLSAVSEPAMLLLLGKPLCPIQPLGSVNTGNRFEILRPDLCTPEQLTSAQSLKVIATLDPSPTVVKRGFVYGLEVRIVYDGETIFRQVFKMLQFARHNREIAAVHERSEELQEGPKYRYTTKVAFSSPSQWAAICKDYNPIHISKLAAKILGFPGKIAHGNHVAALAMTNTPMEMQDALRNDRATWFEVSFKRPVAVPAELDVSLSNHSDAGFWFHVSRKSKVSVHGRLGFL